MASDSSMGGLSFLEATRDVPFEIKRVYYVFGVSAGESRGNHAHKELWQLLFCPYGSIRINMENGEESDSVVLDDPSRALLIGPDVWHSMDWLTDNAVLCVAASDFYNESDYIRDYPTFQKLVETRRVAREQGYQQPASPNM